MKTRARTAVAGILLGVAAIGAVVALTVTEAESATSPGNQGGRRCGGFAGIPCPANLVCVDDPRDDCDPRTGGADCIGICRPAPSL